MAEESRSDMGIRTGRRQFGKMALAGVWGGGLSLSRAEADSAVAQRASSRGRADLKLSVMGSPSEREMVFYKQLGLDYVETYVSGEEDKGDRLIALKKKFENAGLTLNGLYNGNYQTGENADTIRLGRPGRDSLIESFKILMRDMNRAGIRHYHLMGWQPGKPSHGGSYAETGTTRGGAKSLCFDYKKSQEIPYFFDRVYAAEEMWDHFSYFIERVLPAAEENGIKIGLHPNVAVPQIGGVAYIFNCFDSCKRALQIANSDNFGILFCVGTWATGGGKNGSYGDVVEAIRYFGQRGKIFHVHFRNIEAPFPQASVETFPDSGYVDMYEVMKALVEVGFRGTLRPDHYPVFEDSETRRGADRAYSIAYMRGLLDALNRLYSANLEDSA